MAKIDNILVDAVKLDDAAAKRQILGQPVNRVSSSGVHAIIAVGRVWGNDTAELHTRWDAMKSAFNKKDVNVKLTYDDSLGTQAEELAPGLQRGTGRFYLTTTTLLEQDESTPSSGHTIYFTLTCEATFYEQEQLPGQFGPITVETYIGPDGFIRRELNAEFRRTTADALALYESSRTTLLGSSYLGVGGAHKLTGERFLPGFTLGGLASVCRVQLESTETMGRLTGEPAKKQAALRIVSLPAKQFSADPQAGPRPHHVRAVGSIVVDKRELSGDLHNVFDRIKSQVTQQAKQLAKDNTLEFIGVDLTLEPSGSAVTFEADYIGKNTQTFSYTRHETEETFTREAERRDFDGDDMIQERAGPPEAVRIITIARSGIGKATILTPVFISTDLWGRSLPGGGEYRMKQRLVEHFGPDRNEYSDDIWTEVERYTYRLHKFKAGQSPGPIPQGF